MTQTVWKFGLNFTEDGEVLMPEGARVVKARSTNMTLITLWAIVDPERDRVRRRIRVFGTGHPIHPDADTLEYLDTVFDDVYGLVWHVFVGEESPLMIGEQQEAASAVV